MTDALPRCCQVNCDQRAVPIANGTVMRYAGSLPEYHGEVTVIRSEPDWPPAPSHDGHRYTVEISGKGVSRKRDEHNGEYLHWVHAQSLRSIT